MKIISLNTWGGRANKEIFLDFFKTHKGTDIFCLQEVWAGGEHMAGKITGGAKLKNIIYRMTEEVGSILSGHDVYFKPHFGDWYGLAIFVKRNIKVVEEGEIYVHKEKGWADEKDQGNHARNIQWIKIETPIGAQTIINFHGLWNGQGKTDSDDRLVQSENIIAFIKNLRTPHVLVGDFNLRPDTQSVKKLEDAGLINLIKEYGIISTRTSLYTKAEKFADYTFVSKDIKVNDFKILPEEVSDHAAMYLDFE